MIEEINAPKQINKAPGQRKMTLHQLIHLLSWGLILLSITSCLIRNDYNVLFGLLFVGILNRQYVRNKLYYSKIILQVLVGLVLFDIIWMCIIMPCWLNQSGPSSSYWDSLHGLHVFGITFAFFELGLKLGIGALIYISYNKSQGQVKDLFNFNYDISQ